MRNKNNQFIIKNNDVRVTINKNPLEVTSIIYKNTEYVYQQENEWKKSWPICFPWAGKFIDNRYLYQGKEYTMNGHGFFRLIDNWKVIEQQEDYLALKVEIKDQFKDIYPFECNLEVVYKLQDNEFINEVIITNVDKRDMYYGFGWHPAFNINAHSGKISFEQPTKISSIPVNTFLKDNLESVTTKDFEIQKHSFIDSNVYALLENNNKQVNISDDSKQVIIDIQNYNHVLIWKCNNSANYICVEPWASLQDHMDYAGGELSQKPFVQNLKPNHCKTYSLSVIFKK